MVITEDRNIAQKVAENKLKYKCLCIEIIMNVEREMYDYTCNKWGYQNSNKSFKEEFGTIKGKQLTDSLPKKTA